jgi:hypothetical protein
MNHIVSAFELFTKVSGEFTSMITGSQIDDFSEASQKDQRVSDQLRVTIDCVVFMLLDGGAIAARLASAGSVRLRWVIVWMGAPSFVRRIRPKHFSILLPVHRHSADG